MVGEASFVGSRLTGARRVERSPTVRADLESAASGVALHPLGRPARFSNTTISDTNNRSPFSPSTNDRMPVPQRGLTTKPRVVTNGSAPWDKVANHPTNPERVLHSVGRPSLPGQPAPRPSFDPSGSNGGNPSTWTFRTEAAATFTGRPVRLRLRRRGVQRTGGVCRLCHSTGGECRPLPRR